MKFEYRHGLIFVSLDILYEGNLTHIDQCLLDTGSAGTAIDTDSIQFNPQKHTIIKRLQGIGGIEEVACQYVDKIIIDELEFSNLEIEFGDFQSDFGFQGIVGTNILSNLKTTISFAQQTVQFEKESL